MSNPDAYLVEKLREILTRLYKKSAGSVAPFPTFDPPPQRTTLESDTLIEDHSVRFLGEQKLYFENKGREFGGVNWTEGWDSADVDEEVHMELVLRKNLKEFIQVLKMSLLSNSDGAVDGSGPNKIGQSSESNGVPTVTVSTLSEMDFNLTLDDISDLNRLMDGNQSMPFKHVVIILTYFVIACIAIVGNLLVVQLVIRSRRLHTLTHALLANLAVADLLMATLNIPFSAARVIMTEWPFGPYLCRAVPFIQVTSVYVTSITMAVIALDRYQVIMKPLGHRLKGWEGMLLVFSVWTFSGIFALPFALHHKVVTILTVRVVKRCQSEFTSLQYRQWLTVLTFLAQYLVPLLITTISYVSIMHRLGHRSSGLGSTTPRQVEAQSKAKRKTIKMLVLTVIFFAICWAPINIYHLLTHFNVVRHDSTAILVCHLISMSSTCYNPFIYCWLNEHFRREALKWFRCFRTHRSPLVHPGIEINGMLTRADLVCRRNQSSTMVHTMSFRSQVILPCRNFAEHSAATRRGYRPETLFLATPSQDASRSDVFGVMDNEMEDDLMIRSVSGPGASRNPGLQHSNSGSRISASHCNLHNLKGSNLSLHSNYSRGNHPCMDTSV